MYAVDPSASSCPIHLHAQHPTIFSMVDLLGKSIYIYVFMPNMFTFSLQNPLLAMEHLRSLVLQFASVPKTLIYHPGCLQMSRYLHEPIT